MRCASQATKEELARRRTFEDAIKRPYFHVKPLDAAQLSAWGRYLDYAEPKLEDQRVIRLFERCLVACACYVGACSLVCNKQHSAAFAET